MFGGARKKSTRGSEKFYSVYDRKSVRIPKKSVCVKTIKLKNGRGNRYQLYAKKGNKKFYKFVSADDAEKYGKCKSRKSSRKSKKSRRKSKKSRRKSKSSHRHTHRHKRSSKLRKYGSKKTKKHSHKHSHKKGKSRGRGKKKSKKGSRHSHSH